MSSTNTKNEVLSYLENLSLFIVGIGLLGLPLLFSPLTTDFFALPKQALLIIVVSLVLVILGIRMVVEGKVRLRTTPFDLPTFLFLLAILLSAVFAVNRFDSLTAFVPLLFSVLLYFVITNVARTEKAVTFIVSTLVFGTLVSTVISLLSFFKIYVLPFDFAKVQTFTPLGTLLDQAVFLALVLPLAGYVAWPIISPLFNRAKSQDIFGDSAKARVTPLTIAFTVAFALLLVGLGFTVYMLATIAQPLILPFTTGFQTAFAAISQDTGRVLQGFLFGSGYGTYITDFTRFKQATYNASQTLWTVDFFRSSSFFLELLATTGFLGVASFVFLLYKFVKERSFFLPIVLAIVAAFILPFSYLTVALFFVLLAIFASLRALHAPSRYSDLEFYFVALKHGLILAQPEGERAPHDRVNTRYGRILPFAFVLILLILIGGVGYFAGRYFLSDMTFQKSVIAAQANNGSETYTLQSEAIQQFPYRDTYYSIFAQTNLALANSLAGSQPEGASPSAETQQQIVTLIQQSINAGRTAVTLSPQTASNWNNLSAIYRSLIGFGQNAEQFSLLTAQQAVALDPSNPRQYINLGGIYYQLQQWDEAQRQFQVAANMKPDFANAYYNLGHALESKGDLENALAAYQAVEQLVQTDKASIDQIKKEIAAVQEKIASGQTGQGEIAPDTTAPDTQLPEVDEEDRAEIPAPPAGRITPTPTEKATPTPTPAI